MKKEMIIACLIQFSFLHLYYCRWCIRHNQKSVEQDHFKGDLGMANNEKQVEQEAAYPIPISLYNCYRTVRHGHEKRGILLIAFLPLFLHQTCSMLSVGERVHPRCHCGGQCGIRSWRNNFVERTTTVSGKDWCL